jgi:hypothetical protein
VCDVTDYKAEELAALISEHPQVRYCHIRPRFEGFPFNVYATVLIQRTGWPWLREIEALAAPYSCRTLAPCSSSRECARYFSPAWMSPDSARLPDIFRT